MHTIAMRRIVRLDSGQTDLDHAHQTSVRVIENVAVIRLGSGTLVESHCDTDRLFQRDSDRVLPGGRPNGGSRFVEHLEKKP